jgi:acetyltransferase-like isoleucine patch superfamily enzyme
MDSVFDVIRKERDQVKLDWNRVLPTNELFFDRWEKAKYIGAGVGTSIYDSCLILGDVKVGNNTWIGPYTVLDGSGGELSIGDFCSISSGVQIYTHDSVMWSLSGGKKEKVTNTTIIGDNCYIAPMCIISMGVTIGKCCVIAANSFVNKSYPDYSIIAGTPAKRIGEVCINENGDIVLNYV